MIFYHIGFKNKRFETIVAARKYARQLLASEIPYPGIRIDVIDAKLIGIPGCAIVEEYRISCDGSECHQNFEQY